MTENEAIEELKYCVEPNQGFMECRYASREANALAIKALEEIQQYRSIGIVEECREAVERQREKKANLYGDFEDGKLLCPNCEEDLMDLVDCGFSNCPYCGQAISWEESEGEDD